MPKQRTTTERAPFALNSNAAAIAAAVSARPRPPIHFSEALTDAPSDLRETIESVAAAALDEAERRMVAVTTVEAYEWACPEEDEGPEIVVCVEVRSTPEKALALWKAASTTMDGWASTHPQLWAAVGHFPVYLEVELLSDPMALSG